MNWFLLQSGSGEAAFNMALDEALLEQVDRLGRPVLRFYGWKGPAATFGHLQKYSVAAATTALRPLIRRPTGGGIVPHDADWTYSLAVPPGHEWYSLSAMDSYHRMHAWIQRAFANILVPTTIAPTSHKPAAANINPLVPGACFVGHEKFDLLWHGKKIAGAAQRRNKFGLLIQGSVQSPLPLTRKVWEISMAEMGQSEFGSPVQELSPDEVLLARAALLVRERYALETYQRKR